MEKIFKASFILLLTFSLLFAGCTEKQDSKAKVQQTGLGEQVQSANQGDPQNSQTNPLLTNLDLAKVKPNEAGQIMVVMFHNFIESYQSGDKEYTTTFSDFKNLLQTLYDNGYRLIRLNDYLQGNITVPAGYTPIVFTFDDGTSGQFNLVEENGKRVANQNSAVGIMEEFNKTHPDFGLKGTFFVNLGLQTFPGQGTLSERLRYLVDEGFEIGNHTLTHVHLPDVTTAEKIQEEIGGNQKAMLDLIPGYNFTAFSLPFGQASVNLQGDVVKGQYAGVPYENKAIVLVGANPAPSPFNKSFKPLAIPRVRATGLKLVDCDLAWWLKALSKNDQYISDGDPNTITIPEAKEAVIDPNRLNGKNLRTY